MTRAVTIGLGLFTGQRPPGSAAPRYRDAPLLGEAAEKAGFDAFWVSEHHGFRDDYLPAPLTVLAAVAARTWRIRLATGLALAPLYHPVRLAEEAAVVDHLSEGRLVLGLGLGYVTTEFAAYGVPRDDRGARLEALVPLLRTAWSGDPVSGSDGRVALHAERVSPTPHGGRSIPVWLGGYADAAVERAGRLADGFLLGRGDPDLVDRAAALLGRVRDPADDGFTFGVNLVTVLDDDLDALAAFAHQQQGYEAVQRHDDPYAGTRRRAGSGPLALGDPRDYLHAHGDAGAVVAAIERVLEQLDGWARVHIVLRALFPEPDVEAQGARIRRLGHEVLPRLALTTS